MRALVTGASRGIGRATALRLGNDGYDIAAHYHEHAAEASSVVEALRTAGRESFALSADLSNGREVGSLASTLVGRWPTVDALVMNAGPYPRQEFSSSRQEDFDALYRTHVSGPARLVQELLPALRRSPAPSVVFVSSVLAFVGSTHGAAYASAKAGIVGLTRSLARELAPQIRVNAVAPGSIDTAILASDAPEVRRARERTIPLGRIGRPEEVAETIAFLVTARSSYITGAVVPVNGGISLL